MYGPITRKVGEIPMACNRKTHKKLHGSLTSVHRIEDLAIEKGMAKKVTIDEAQNAVDRMLAYVWDNMRNIYLPSYSGSLDEWIVRKELPRDIEVQYKGLSSYYGRYNHKERLIKLNNRRGIFGNTLDTALHELAHGVVRALPSRDIQAHNVIGPYTKVVRPSTHGADFKAIYEHLIRAY